MSRRTYNQFCGLAGALDAVGERWTLLIVRDLSGGPKRYSDLAGSLEGIGTSLLAARLKQLEVDKVIVRRDLPPPAASTVYELADAGWELVDALTPIAVWGARHSLSKTRLPDQGFQPEWSLAFVGRAMRNALSDSALPAVIEFTIDGSTAVATVDRHNSAITPGRAQGEVNASIATDSATLAAIVAGRVDLASALESGQLRASGDDWVMLSLASALSQVAH